MNDQKDKDLYGAALVRAGMALGQLQRIRRDLDECVRDMDATLRFGLGAPASDAVVALLRTCTDVRSLSNSLQQAIIDAPDIGSALAIVRDLPVKPVAARVIPDLHASHAAEANVQAMVS